MEKEWNIFCLEHFAPQTYFFLAKKLRSSIIFSASALKCWRCSSDVPGGAFCSDPFDETNINEYQKRWSLVECLSATGQSA